MAPPQSVVATLSEAPARAERASITSITAALSDEVKASKSRLLRLLVRAMSRAAVAERAVAEKDELIHQLRSLALTDPLTGLMNRRSFEDYLGRVTAAAQPKLAAKAAAAKPDINRTTRMA